MLVDYHVHGRGHQDHPPTMAELARYVETGRKQGIKEIGFADHDWYLAELDLAVYPPLQAEYPDVAIRVGLEVEFFPDKLGEITRRLMPYQFDYLIGSVHYFDDWNFDHPDLRERFQEWDLGDFYRQYFNLVAQAAQTGLFEITGHLDLPKIFGHRPPGNILDYAEPALTAIKAADMAVEINTNGLYKPVGEIYPELKLLQRCYQLGIPITLSSDAHQPETVGRDVALARDLALEIGYREIATFKNRHRIMAPI